MDEKVLQDVAASPAIQEPSLPETKIHKKSKTKKSPEHSLTEIPFEVPPALFEQRGRIFSVINQKGGCGKTTTTINLGAGLVLEKFQVLLIDLDPQANATMGLGLHLAPEEKTAHDLFTNPAVVPSDLIRPTSLDNLHIIPSSWRISSLITELPKTNNWEYLLRGFLRSLKPLYHYILIDCPPALNALTVNALTASEDMIIPLQTHYYALEGMKELFLTAHSIREKLNPHLKSGKILPTLFDRRTKISHEMLAAIRTYFSDQVFETIISVNVRLIESVMLGQSVLTYAPDSKGAADYRALCRELVCQEAGIARPNPSPQI